MSEGKKKLNRSKPLFVTGRLHSRCCLRSSAASNNPCLHQSGYSSWPFPLSQCTTLPLLRPKYNSNTSPIASKSRIHSPITRLSAPLHILTIHAGRPFLHQPAHFRLAASLEVDILEVEGVDVAGEVAEDGQADVDEEVGAAAGDEEDADGWDCV